MPCITLSSGKSVCYGNNEYRPGGKTLQVKGSSFNIPKSQQEILEEQARMKGDMSTAPAIVNQQQRMREEASTKKRLSNQPTVKLSEAQKKAISAQGLKEDVLAEQMMRNKQSLSNPDDNSYIEDLGNVLYSAGEDIQDNGLLGIGNPMLSVPTGLISGRYESPSQAIGRFALRNDANQLRNAMIDDQGNPTGLGMALDIFGPIALEQAVAKGIGAIKNIPKLNSNAEVILNKPSSNIPSSNIHFPIDDMETRIWQENPHITLEEINNARNKSLEYFNKTYIPDQKAHSLVMKKELLDKMPNYTSLKYGDEGTNLGNFYTNARGNQQMMDDFLIRQGYDITKMTPEERLLMESYGHGYDKVFNESLRKNPRFLEHATKNQGYNLGFYEEQAETLNKGLLKNKFKEPTVVRRGVGIDYNVDLLDPITHKPTGQTKRRSELVKGDIFKDEGFLSTSIDPMSFWGTPYYSELIEIPGGGVQSLGVPEAAASTFWRGEREAILPKGLIREVIEDGGPSHKYNSSWANPKAKFRTKILNPYTFMGGYLGYEGLNHLPKTEEPMQRDGGKNKPNIKETPAQADALNDAKTFQEQWMESPMYNQMITNSVAKDNPYGLDSSYVDYITMKRKQGLDATTTSATDWSGDHRNVVPGKSDYYYKNQLRGVNYKDTDKQRLDSFPSPLGYIFNDPNTAYRNEGYNFVPELGYFNTLVNHNLHNHHFRDTSGHEISHATDWNGWFIPESDKIKMAKYKNVYAKNPAEGDYIGTPTETRARLNSIRQLSKDAGYYDPFTQRATMDVLNKFKTLDNNQYKQLKQIYTDAEILDMLNTISMSDNNQYQNYG